MSNPIICQIGFRRLKSCCIRAALHSKNNLQIWLYAVSSAVPKKQTPLKLPDFPLISREIKRPRDRTRPIPLYVQSEDIMSVYNCLQILCKAKGWNP